MGGLAVLFFLAVSPPAQSQTSKFPDMVRIEADCFTMGSEEFIVDQASPGENEKPTSRVGSE